MVEDYVLRQAAARGRLGTFLTPEERRRNFEAEKARFSDRGRKLGTVAGAILGAYFGNPALGAQIGSSVGGGTAFQSPSSQSPLSMADLVRAVIQARQS